MKLRHNITCLVFIAATLFVAGCTYKESVDRNVVDEGAEIHLKYGGKEVSFEPTYATFATFRKALILKNSDIQNKDDHVPAVVHRIYLSNYDLQLIDPSRSDHRRIDADGMYRVEIQIEAEKDAGGCCRIAGRRICV